MTAVLPQGFADIHLTHRAVEWLEHSTTIVGYTYIRPLQLKACVRLEDLRYEMEVVRNRRGDKELEAKCTEQGHPIIAPELRVIERWSCAVADVRAVWLSMHIERKPGDPPPYTVTMNKDPRRLFGQNETARYDPKHDFRWVRSPVMLPTCPTCNVILDEALTKAIPKTGAYRDIDDEGNVVWQTHPRRRWTPTKDNWKTNRERDQLIKTEAQLHDK